MSSKTFHSIQQDGILNLKNDDFHFIDWNTLFSYILNYFFFTHFASVSIQLWYREVNCDKPFYATFSAYSFYQNY